MENVSIIQLIKDTFKGYGEDNIGTFAASVAYYTAFSFVPILVFSLITISLFYNPDTVQSQIITQTEEVVGKEQASQLEEVLTNIHTPGGGIPQFLFGAFLLAWSGSSVFVQLETALNTIFKVKNRDGVGLLSKIKNRFLTFSMVSVIAFLLLISMVATIVISFLTSYLNDALPFPGVFLELINIVVPFMLITVLFAMIYRLLPDVVIPKNVLWLGSAVTSLLFTLGKTFIGMYLANSSAGSAYGAASSVIFLLLWVFYSSQIFFIGAEFMKAYAKNTNSAIIPKHDAIHFDVISVKEERRNYFQPGFFGKNSRFFCRRACSRTHRQKEKNQLEGPVFVASIMCFSVSYGTLRM